MTKTPFISEDKIRRVTRVLKTLSHPARIKIIEYLFEYEKLSVNEIAEKVNISQSNASQHLKALEDIDILMSQRLGKSILYEVRNHKIFDLLQMVNTCTDCD